MKQQLLPPGMEDAEETNRCSEMLRIASNLAERFSDGAKEQIVELGLILEGEGMQLVRQREDDVEVTGLKQFVLPGFDPTMTRLSLALVAMTIATAVI